MSARSSITPLLIPFLRPNHGRYYNMCLCVMQSEGWIYHKVFLNAYWLYRISLLLRLIQDPIIQDMHALVIQQCATVYGYHQSHYISFRLEQMSIYMYSCMWLVSLTFISSHQLLMFKFTIITSYVINDLLSEHAIIIYTHWFYLFLSFYHTFPYFA